MSVFLSERLATCISTRWKQKFSQLVIMNPCSTRVIPSHPRRVLFLHDCGSLLRRQSHYVEEVEDIGEQDASMRGAQLLQCGDAANVGNGYWI